MRRLQRKPTLSAHQKQIRFLTGLTITTSILATLLFLWLMNVAANSSH